MVNVAVVVNVWIRPQNQRKQFEVLKKARPKTLFLASDGSRNESEKMLLDESRSIVEDIDWECHVYKIYEDTNLGLYKMWKKTADFVFSKVEKCIFLEDDHIPSVSYFNFCADLLEKYKDDERILMINGMNHLGIYNSQFNDYFFTHTGSIWGVAFWKRTYEKFLSSEVELNDYDKNLFKNNANFIGKKRYVRKFHNTNSNSDYFLGPEFNLAYIQITHNQLIVVPTKNMINNIGFDQNATHASELKFMPKGIRKIFNMKTYEFIMPLKHPEYVMPDFEYTRRVNRIMGFNYQYINIYRKFENVIYRLIYGDFKGLLRGIKRQFHAI